MKSEQILELLRIHHRVGLTLVGGGAVHTLDGDVFALAPELLRLANLGAAVELVHRHGGGASAPLCHALQHHDATWPRPTP